MKPDKQASVVTILVLSHVLGGLAVAVWAWSCRWPHPSVIANQAITFGQFGLLSVWVGLGRGRWFPRLMVAAIAASTAFTARLMVVQLTTGTVQDAETIAVEWAMLCFTGSVPILLVAAPLFVLRKRGAKLVLYPPDKLPAAPHLQFSIRQMLLWTVVAAVLLSAAHFTRRIAWIEDGSICSPADTSTGEFALIVSVLFLWFASVPLLMVWACLDVGRPMTRLMLALAAALALGALPANSFRGSGSDYALWAVMTLLEANVSAASLLVFRWLGYRLVYTSQTTSADAAACGETARP